MSTAIEQIAAPLQLKGISFGEYLRIRRANPGYRMIYCDGTLEIMSPEYLHERPARMIGITVSYVATAQGIPFVGSGSTTFRLGDRLRRRGSGKEPDESFYFAHEPQIRGKDRIVLPDDPPPDLWIEVDNRGSSQGRLPLYARLGVPEVWRYRVRQGTLWFGRLAGGTYEEIDRSLSLPMLTPGLVLFAMERARDTDEGTWRRWLQAWAPTLEAPRP